MDSWARLVVSTAVRPSQDWNTVKTGAGGIPWGLVVAAKGSLLPATKPCCDRLPAPPVAPPADSDPAAESVAWLENSAISKA